MSGKERAVQPFVPVCYRASIVNGRLQRRTCANGKERDGKTNGNGSEQNDRDGKTNGNGRVMKKNPSNAATQIAKFCP